MGRFIFCCFGSSSSKCCPSSHISPKRQHQSQEATPPSAVVDEQQPIQIKPHYESAEEELVAIDLNATSDAQLDNLLPLNKKKSEDDEEEEKEANCSALSSTKHHPCSDDDRADESYNDFEVNVVEELESSESLFSLSIDSRRKHHHIISAETDEVTSSRTPFSFPICVSTPANEIKSSTTSSIEFNHSILKPIENLSGWKTPVVTRPATSSPLKSHNNNNEEEEEEEEEEDEVEEKENSLSSWLVVDSESTSFNSVGNNNKKMMKQKNSPDDETNNKMMKMKNSPDDETTKGTVASYWLHTGQAAATPDSGFTSKKQHQNKRDLSLRPCVPLSQLL